jgi:DNA-binding MurR/RpiR family transcriptional regulator
MQHIMSIEQVVQRARAIRLPLKELAGAANVSAPTVHRALARGGCNSRILKALQHVVIQQETELQAHLNSLHPTLAGKVDEERS